MSEVILTKNCKTSQKDPPPQKKVATFSKGANDNTMTITWLQLWDRFLIFTIVLVLCSCTTNIWSKVNTTWQLCYCIFQKGPQEEYYNPAETLVNGHFLGGRWVVNFPLKEVRLLRDRPLLRNFQLACSILTADLIWLGNGRKHWSPNWYWEYYSKE